MQFKIEVAAKNQSTGGGSDGKDAAAVVTWQQH